MPNTSRSSQKRASRAPGALAVKPGADAARTQKRKGEHLDIVLKKDTNHREKSPGFEDVEFEYLALPEIDYVDVSLATSFLGKKFKLPLLASSMTGGTPRAREVNQDIAKACEEMGVGMGLGSCRAMLETHSLADTYRVRRFAPAIFLAANLGVLQLKEYPMVRVEKMVRELGADALYIHVNAAQEAMQNDSPKNFSGCLKLIGEYCQSFSKPVLVKEVGHGLSLSVIERLAPLAPAAIDVAGAGGTSWVGIDSLRNDKELGKVFWDFGVPTVAAIVHARMVFEGPLVASGGIRNGLDAAKALALGADVAGMAAPIFKAQQKGGAAGVKKELGMVARELATALFLTGSKSVAELREKRTYLFGPTADWVHQ